MRSLCAHIILVTTVCMIFLTPVRATSETLFDELGGKDGVTRIVDTTLDLSLKDPRIASTFEESNIPRLRGLLFEHMCALTGGPCTYKGQTMKAAHKGLHLQNSDFNALVENLQQAMRAAQIPFGTQNELLAILAPMQRDVVTK